MESTYAHTEGTHVEPSGPLSLTSLKLSNLLIKPTIAAREG